MHIFSESQISISVLVEGLREGKTIVYPTETCYGLGCDAANASAVEKIFEMKQRQKDKPMIVIAKNREMVEQYVEWNQTIDLLAERYWPGPLTIVARAKEGHGLAAGVVGANDMIAFRLTDHPFAAALVTELGRPIVSTSANISSLKSPYDVRSIVAMFETAKKQPDIIIDAGILPQHSPSTIVRVLDGDIHIVRQGEIAIDPEQFRL